MRDSPMGPDGLAANRRAALLLPAFLLALSSALGAPGGPSILVYQNGDRAQGKVLRMDATSIVFFADHFGKIEIPRADATVTPVPAVASGNTSTGAAPPPAPASPVAASPSPPKSTPPAEAEAHSIANVTAAVRQFFGNWHGRISASSEVLSDTAAHDIYALDGHFTRKWTQDSIDLSGHYDYVRTDGIVAIDLARVAADTQHDFNRHYYARYRPSVEWSHVGAPDNINNHYVLSQQDAGIGYRVLTRPGRTFSFGVAGDLFDVWNTAPSPNHNSKVAESIFDESSLALPWRMTISQQSVWYPIANKRDGWEYHLDLSKKLTETFTVSARQEARRRNPDGSAPDYSRLKFLLGIDF
ncbi:MAG TPA: hypothetical protein VHE61_00900 [Opitutaceae bacterium]|nr:hypothetical protein [Opitutaceae bacterium]